MSFEIQTPQNRYPSSPLHELQHPVVGLLLKYRVWRERLGLRITILVEPAVIDEHGDEPVPNHFGPVLREIRIEGVKTFAGKSMSDSDVRTIIKWGHCSICCDGNVGRHPRGYFTFTRVLGLYAWEVGLISFEDPVLRMTGLMAQHLGIWKRGLIKSGHVADLVLFDLRWPSTDPH